MNTSFFINAETARPMVDQHKIIPVFVGSPDSFNKAHLSGSLLVKPAQLVSGEKPAPGKMPSIEKLSALFQGLGLNTNDSIMAYDDEGGGWAGRLIWQLDQIGHKNYYMLDGGINRWQALSYPIESGAFCAPKPSNYPITIQDDYRINAEPLLAAVEADEVIIWDARSKQEHEGSKVVAQRGGRIPGAKNVDWLELMDNNNSLALKPLDSVAALLRERGILTSPQKPIVTHCQSHHRSGLSYVVGKLLDLDIKAYDGSWSEWGNSETLPVESDV